MLKSPYNQPITLLSTKLTPPYLPPALVQRSRLLNELEAVHRYPLTLICASAGSGKTTLLAAWIASAGEVYPVAWLSLEELDNDPIQFWAACIGTLQTRLPGIGEMALAMLHAQEVLPLSTCLIALLHELEQVGNEFILVLDDYHLIADQTITESMRWLLDHLPANLHLVLATRTDPEFPLARLRVRGQLLEIRDSDLRFTPHEASRFLVEGMRLPLSQDDVTALQTRTEGWIAGLQLAALSLRKREDSAAFLKEFTGSHRFVLDYVQQDILVRLPDMLQDFVLQTSILTRMNAALCQAVTMLPTQQVCQELLETLERSNLFVVPLDEQRHWYRFHDLFREALLARLQATVPELVPQLHARAARWYAGQNQVREAITYALTAQDFALAAELMEQAAADLSLRGEAATVHRWVSALPDTVLQQHARLALDAALRLLETRHIAISDVYRSTQIEVERTIARVESMLGGLPHIEVAFLQHRIHLLHALIATRSLLVRCDREGMRLLVQETETLADADEIRWQLVPLAIAFWYTESLLREGALLIPRLLQTKRQVLAAGDQGAILRVQRWLAFAYLRAGRLRLAEEECLQALALTHAIGEHSSATGYFYYFLAAVYYETNRLPEAFNAVHELLQIAQLWQQADLAYAANEELLRLSLANGDNASAHAALAELEQRMEQERLASHAGTVAALRARYWLATSNLHAARNWAKQVVFSPETWDPNRIWELQLLIRVFLADERYAQALALLHQYYAYPDRPGDIINTIGFLALRAVVLYSTGQTEQARATTIRLLALTEADGYVRVYLDAGEPMRRVLQELRDTAPEHENGLAPASVPFVAKLLSIFETEAQHATPGLYFQPKRLDALDEPLTGREHEVLRLLVGGASNNEIADTLVISLATAKKHVSNILGKLQVTSRAQAIARANNLPDLV
ncbi:MAG: LuxR family transcriptional regulator [Herpetosiphonaceae bacterium]|nr:LuxR family transcriptional regulator [Herpetosiphonaceae bacterium]